MADVVPATLIYKGSSVYLKDSSNYVYIQNTSYTNNKGETTSWKCRNHKKSNCKARALTFKKNGDEDRTEYLRHSDVENHSHLSSIMDVRHLEEVSKAQKKAVENKELKPRSLFGDISNNLAKEGIVMRSSEKSIIRSVQRARRLAGGQWPLPKSFREAIRFLPDQLCYTTSGDFRI